MSVWTNQNQSTLAGSGGVVGGSLGANLVAASSIAITDFVHFVSGSATINTITGGIARPQEIFLIPLTGSTWTLGTSGNIKPWGAAPVFDRPVHLVWDGSTSWREVAPPVTFSDFTPSLSASSGSWSIGTITTARYAVVGKMMTIIYSFFAVTVTGTPVNLAFAIPGGYTAANRSDNAIGACVDNGAVFTGGAAKTTGAAGTSVQIYKVSGAGWATSAAQTVFTGQIVLEVQ